MTYTVTNFRTKKALKEALASGQEIRVFQPGRPGGNFLLTSACLLPWLLTE